MEEPKKTGITIPIKLFVLLIVIIIILGYCVWHKDVIQPDYLEEEIDISNEDVKINTEEITCKLPTVTTLSTGTYEVGIDIAAGIYNLEVISGSGLINGDLQEGYLSEIMGIVEGLEEYYSETYKNLYLKIGDEFEISGGVEIEFTPIS